MVADISEDFEPPSKKFIVAPLDYSFIKVSEDNLFQEI